MFCCMLLYVHSSIAIILMGKREPVALSSLLRQGLSKSDFYGDLVYRLKKIVGSSIFFSAVHKNNFPL